MKQLTIPDEIITGKIYFFRGKKVMIDRDLAKLYGVTTGNLYKAVKRNIKRFPGDFMFRLTRKEYESIKFHFGIFKKGQHTNLIFQIGTSKWGGTRKMPYAFTREGISMLSGLLNSDRAIAVNIRTRHNCHEGQLDLIEGMKLYEHTNT